jgi:hypothetical protein
MAYSFSYLQDNSGDMQSTSNPVRIEFHFSTLHHGDYDVLWGAELWFVVCGCVLRTSQSLVLGGNGLSVTC